MPARMIIKVFKVIAFAMLMVFLVDIAIYLVKAYQLRQRIESVMVSLQRTVMQNNYLPPSEKATYETIFGTITNTLNGNNIDDERFGREAKAKDVGIEDSFIYLGLGEGIRLNYDTDVYTVPSNLETTYKELSAAGKVIYNPKKARYVNLATPAEYGDLKLIQVAVTLRRPIWGFAAGSKKGTKTNSWKSNAQGENVDGAGTGLSLTTLHFSYLVPCLHYNAIT